MPLFLSFFPTENIRLRNDHEFQHRVFVPLCYMPITDENFPLLNFPVGIFTVKTAQIIVPQIFRKTLRACPRSGEQHDPVAASFQTLQISRKHFEAVIIRVDAFRLDRIRFPQMKVPAFGFQHGKCDPVPPVDLRRHFFHGKNLRKRRGLRFHLHRFTVLQTFPVLFFRLIHPL